MDRDNQIKASDREPSYWYEKAQGESGNTVIALSEGYYNTAASNESSGAQNYSPVEPPVEGVTYRDAIDVERVRFHAHFRKMKAINYSIVAVCLVLIVATIVVALVANSTSATWGNYVIWPLFALAVVAFIVSAVFSHFVKKKNNVLLSDYLDRWCDLMASSAYSSQEDVTDLEFCVDAKVLDADLINTHYWSVINAVDSRNRVVGKLGDISFSDTEVIVEVPPYSRFAKDIEERKYRAIVQDEQYMPASDRVPSYWYTQAYLQVSEDSAPLEEPKRDSNSRAANIGGFGKFICFDTKAGKGEGIIVVRAVKDTYPPTDVREYKFDTEASELMGDDFVVWSTSREFSRKVLTASIIQILKSLPCDETLQDWFFVYNSKELAFFLNFSDEIMELPFKTLPEEERLNRYSDAVHSVLDAVRNLTGRQSS